MAKRDYYPNTKNLNFHNLITDYFIQVLVKGRRSLGVSKDASAGEINKVCSSFAVLTNSQFSATFKSQHPVLALASAGLFIGTEI